MAKAGRKKLHKGIAILLVVLLFFLTVFGVLCLGAQYQMRRWNYWKPDYDKIDIEELLDKPSRTAEDYDVLYAQTGLTEIGIEDTLAQKDGKQTVLDIQRYYFRDISIYGEYASPIMYQEKTRSFATLAHLKSGDVLVTASTLVSWWRWGHSALVIDGEEGLLIESIGIGKDSKYNTTEVFADLPSFMVLRPKADEETKAQVVSYAKQKLVGLPYVFTVGILSKKAPKKIKYTQCAHLVWYAYKRFGLDIDGNGGGLVLPKDIANSSNVEIVQIYGFDPDRLWK
ncbi:MAG: hypothetical protein IJY21_04800 [Clostridia bacterium]|nr:hypothetical protein [Clostridia bacterium]